MSARQAEVFLEQARASEGRSPLYTDLCRRLAEEPLVGEVFGRPVERYDPLRLLGGVHYLVLEGKAAWDDVSGALEAHREFLARFVREQNIQTNEVQRSWMLLPCFLEAGRRTGAEALDVIELGPSAGLNLVWDRYGYRYAAGRWGSEGTRLELRGEERGRVPRELLLLGLPVRSRVGVDIDPVDATTEEGARLLRAFVWPDQTWRLKLLDRAVAALREDPPELVQGDLVEELPRLLERRRDGALTLVFHTAVLNYLSAERRERVFSALEAAGREGPLAFVASRRPRDGAHTYYGMTLQVWPGGRRDELAHADFHGAWIDWLPPA